MGRERKRGRAYVEALRFKEQDLAEFVSDLRAEGADSARAELLLDYPTVYVAHHPNAGKRRVYVGETSDIRSRTLQHLRADIVHRQDWSDLAANAESRMFVIGHSLFNKSLTLDVENRLMHWLTGVDEVGGLNNRRSNAQNRYYTRDLLDDAFGQIWRELRRLDPALFPTERLVRESALFKASPFHRLTAEQMDAKADVLDAVQDAMASGAVGELILVEGAAGTGKTVLLSTLFYELCRAEDDPALASADARLLVNHEQQFTVYEEMAKKLGLASKGGDRVSRPTRFIKRTDPSSPVDIVLIDEAHLLWTQGKQSYQGDNQLLDIIDRARVVIAVFDPQQVVATNGYWEPEQLDAVKARATRVIQMSGQMRIDGSAETVTWIRDLIDRGRIGPIPRDETYDLQIFESPDALRDAINEKSRLEESLLSRLTATFDWPYSGASAPAGGGTWDVVIGDFSVPWNLQTKPLRTERGLSWAERASSVGECGSTFTVQGFDLNYAGVIIGPSVKYRHGHVVFDPTASANKGATQKRTLSDGSKQAVGEQLLRNELNILLTRGVQGLYIYAVDDELRSALLDARSFSDG